MKNSIKLVAALIAIILMSSFKNKSVENFIGTYGVSDSDPSDIKLIIQADHTFSYQDFSAQDEKISVKGNWTLEGKKIVLKGNEANKKFHATWTFDKNGDVAKSRKGLCFYRLCKIA